MLNANDSTSILAPFVNDASFSGDRGIAAQKPLTFENETPATTHNNNDNLVNGLADLDSFDFGPEPSESSDVDVAQVAGDKSKKNGKKRKKAEAVGDSPSDVMGDAKKKKRQTKSANQRRNIK